MEGTLTHIRVIIILKATAPPDPRRRRPMFASTCKPQVTRSAKTVAGFIVDVSTRGWTQRVCKRERAVAKQA